MLVVELDGVWAQYGRDASVGDLGPPRLRDVGFAIGEGEMVALLGPNGAGKSTLLRVIGGALPASQGIVKLLGDPVIELDRIERAKRVAVLPQVSEVALGFSVRQVVAMGRAPYQDGWMRQSPTDQEAVETAIRDCQLDRLAHRPVAELSGGEQKRVHVGRVLAQATPILLLDEPAAALDICYATKLFKLIGKQVRARGLTCIAAMHDLHAAARYADRVILIDEGKIIADGSVDTVMTETLLSRTFGVRIEVGRIHDHAPLSFYASG